MSAPVPSGGSSLVLPPLYAGWIDALLRSPVSSEPHATCDDCAMCSTGGAAPAAGEMLFSPRIKCCTYLPHLPNFLVGRALDDPDFAFSAGRATLEARIDAGVGVSPLGLLIPKLYSLLYDNGRAEGFGRAESMRCPHYLEEAGGRCGVWKHRNSTCTTWFCKHDRGAAGMHFWHRMRELLARVESSLAAWCVLESGLGPEQIEALFPLGGGGSPSRNLSAAELDSIPDAGAGRRLWGDFAGRERDFYRECGRRVTGLSWDDVLAIGGGEVVVRARLVQAARDELARTDLPDGLVPGSFEMQPLSDGGARLVSYSATDPIDLDADAFRILGHFRGGPTAGAVSDIEEELGLRVDGDLLRMLVDFEILVPAGHRPK